MVNMLLFGIADEVRFCLLVEYERRSSFVGFCSFVWGSSITLFRLATNSLRSDGSRGEKSLGRFGFRRLQAAVCRASEHARPAIKRPCRRKGRSRTRTTEYHQRKLCTTRFTILAITRYLSHLVIRHAGLPEIIVGDVFGC